MPQPAFRLALRVEGEFWNAYMALQDTMEGSVLLGSIRLRAVERNSDMKGQFMRLMQTVLSDVAEEIGFALTWSEMPRPASESERGGSA